MFDYLKWAHPTEEVMETFMGISKTQLHEHEEVKRGVTTVVNKFYLPPKRHSGTARAKHFLKQHLMKQRSPSGVAMYRDSNVSNSKLCSPTHDPLCSPLRELTRHCRSGHEI